MAIQDKVGGTWRDLSRGLKFLASGVVVIALAAIIWGSYTILHQDYGTLFSQLTAADAATIVDALKKQKIPYRLSAGGTAIEVPEDRVYETRLALMSSNVSLSGGVGFEIFDKQGLGATEQSQRVSYQRALQGELARSIAALDNVKQTRVHLVLPESTLFKRDRQMATAAVTVTMQPGHTLERQQIVGIQRLVAASVAGLEPSHVVIADQRGVTLSEASATESSDASLEARLDIQRQIETHIAKKIVRLLDSAVGPGQAIVSVTAAISFDAIKTTTQDLLPVRGSSEHAVTRKRQVVSGNAADASADVASETATHRGTSTIEVDYEYGRRVEEVIAAPGAIRRLTVGVIVPPRIGEEQQRRITDIVQVAAGIDATRGDVVSIQPLAQVVGENEDKTAQAAATDEQNSAGTSTKTIDNGKGVAWPNSWTREQWMIAAVVFVLLAGVLALLAKRNGRPRVLSNAKREALLQEIRQTLGDGLGDKLGDASRIASIPQRQVP
ncbi:MAG TPA: flagellar basal-body MS-ring/collar protein FliF [Steroidobacteraceae bacterium]|nr:flagellar basal-body MS-ring/collar protein FliF [Steroidobacteraceae bacterium]